MAETYSSGILFPRVPLSSKGLMKWECISGWKMYLVLRHLHFTWSLVIGLRRPWLHLPGPGYKASQGQTLSQWLPHPSQHRETFVYFLSYTEHGETEIPTPICLEIMPTQSSVLLLLSSVWPGISKVHHLPRLSEPSDPSWGLYWVPSFSNPSSSL